MKIGMVSGSVWATKKVAALGTLPLLCVKTDKGTVVAVDLVGAGIGEQVIVTFGGGARMLADGSVDAAVVAICDEGGQNRVHS